MTLIIMPADIAVGIALRKLRHIGMLRPGRVLAPFDKLSS